MQRTKANRKSSRQHKLSTLLSAILKMGPSDTGDSGLTRKSIKSCNGELHIYKLQILTESVECNAGICRCEKRGRSTAAHISI